MIITLFFISSILLVEVSGKKYKEHSDPANTVIILTTGGVSAKMNHHNKDNGLVRFPRGDGKSDSPISIEVKGISNSEKNKPTRDSTSKLMKGFSPSYGNGIAPFTSLEYLYGNHVISKPSIRTRAHVHTRKTGEKSESPASEDSEDENSYLGYYDHHHYHYYRNGLIMDQKGRAVAVYDEVQHEPPVVDDFHGHGHFNIGGNNEHGHFHQHHHTGSDNGHAHSHNNGDNGYYYHGHYGPDGVVHFQSENSEGHGHGHGTRSFSYGSGDGYHYYYGNDDQGSGFHYHSNYPQENHHHDLQSNGQPQHRPQEFGFHDQPNSFNSHGVFRQPEGIPEFHGNDQRHHFHGFSNNGGQNFEGGHHERYPSDRPISEPHTHGHNFRPHGHDDFPILSEQVFLLENPNIGPQHQGQGNFGAHGNKVGFRPQGYSSAHFDVDRRHLSASHNHVHEAHRPDSTRNSFNGGNGYRSATSSTDTEFILKNRLQNPFIGDIYKSANGGRFYKGITVHNNEFVPSEKETDGFRYGEPGWLGAHLNQRQNYRPVHTTGDYGHGVYYGNNHLGHSRRSVGGIGGYAQRFGYSSANKTEVRPAIVSK